MTKDELRQDHIEGDDLQEWKGLTCPACNERLTEIYERHIGGQCEYRLFLSEEGRITSRYMSTDPENQDEVYCYCPKCLHRLELPKWV